MKLNKEKMVKGEIPDATGHTDFFGTMAEAVTTIMDSAKKHGKWAYLNGDPFVFKNFDAVEQKQVWDRLNDAEEPHFVLTGALKGGASNTTYRTKVTDEPIVSALTRSKKRPQLAIAMSNRDGKEYVDVMFSDFKDDVKRLAKHGPQIIAQINEILSNIKSQKTTVAKK